MVSRGASVIPAKTHGQGLGFHPVELTPTDLAPGQSAIDGKGLCSLIISKGYSIIPRLKRACSVRRTFNHTQKTAWVKCAIEQRERLKLMMSGS